MSHPLQLLHFFRSHQMSFVVFMLLTRGFLKFTKSLPSFPFHGNTFYRCKKKTKKCPFFGQTHLSLTVFIPESVSCVIIVFVSFVTGASIYRVQLSQSPLSNATLQLLISPAKMNISFALRCLAVCLSS